MKRDKKSKLLALEGPRLQNMPMPTEASRKVRVAFLPKGERVVVCPDFDQIEMRLYTELTKGRDQSMKENFKAIYGRRK